MEFFLALIWGALMWIGFLLAQIAENIARK